METCCATLKSTAHLTTGRKSGFGYGETGFWGERIRGSLNDPNNLGKILNLEKKVKKIKSGVACSVLTRESGKETLVSPSHPIQPFFSCNFWVNQTLMFSWNCENDQRPRLGRVVEKNGIYPLTMPPQDGCSFENTNLAKSNCLMDNKI